MVSSYDAQNLPTRRASDLALRQNGTGFEAVMTHYRGIRLASGSDFDDDTGRLKAGLTPDKDVLLLSEEDARALAERLPARSEEHTSELQSRGHLVCRLWLE